MGKEKSWSEIIYPIKKVETIKIENAIADAISNLMGEKHICIIKKIEFGEERNCIITIELKNPRPKRFS